MIAANVAESLNDERMLRPVERRCYPACQQLAVVTGASSAATAATDLPAGLQQLLGNIIIMCGIYLLRNVRMGGRTDIQPVKTEW